MRTLLVRHKLSASIFVAFVSSFTVWACGSSNDGATTQNGNEPGAGEGGVLDSGGDGGPPACTTSAPTSADLYVSPSGQDSADGSQANPTNLKSVQSKIQALQAGRTTPIVVFLLDGTYDLKSELAGPWQLTVSGTAQAPIMYAAAPGAKPVLSGGTAITGWTKTTLNSVTVWQASASGLAPFEQLWVNGVRRYRPTSTVGYLYNANAEQGDGGITTFTSFYYSGNDVAASYYDQAHVEILGFENWTMSREHVESIDTAAKTVTIHGTTNTEPMFHGYMPSHRYLIDNVRENLSQPGQWYLDIPAQKIDYVPLSDTEDPNTESIVAPQEQALLSAAGVSNVTLQGIAFEHSNWIVPDTGWKDCQTETDPSAALPAAVSLQDTSNFDVISCEFSHLGAIGVEIVRTKDGASFPNAQADCKTTFDNEIVQSLVSDTGGSGIRVGTWPRPNDTDQNVAQCDLVANNAVTGTGRFFPSGNGIVTGNAHHLDVSHNEVSDTYTYAIDVGMTYGNRPDTTYTSVGLAHDNTIEFNLVHDVGQGVTSDIGGIYTATGPQTGNVVQNNVVHDVTHDPGNPSAQIPEGYGGWGLYNDASSSNVTWQNNLAYRATQSPFHFHYGMNGVVQNNIFAYGTEGVVERTSAEAHLSFTFKDNIIYWDTGIWQRGDWSCPLGALSQCVASSDNLYVAVGSATTQFIDNRVNTKLGQMQKGSTLTFAEWQGLGEDPSPSTLTSSITFGTADHPDFTLPASLPTNFKPFDPTQAGRSCGSYTTPTVPPAFPLQPWPAPL